MARAFFFLLYLALFVLLASELYDIHWGDPVFYRLALGSEHYRPWWLRGYTRYVISSLAQMLWFALGMLLSLGLWPRRFKQQWLLDLHLGLTAGCFLLQAIWAQFNLS
jgi:hypothetical protein